MKEVLVKSKSFYKSLKQKVVLDIGCNDGSLLDFYKREGAITIGIEPTNAIDEARLKGHHTYKSYFDKKTILKLKKNLKRST